MSLYRMQASCAVERKSHMGESSSVGADNTILPFSQGRIPTPPGAIS